MGRITDVATDPQTKDIEFEVSFPEKKGELIPETGVYVRCLELAGDPVETLIYRAHETPFFHSARSAFQQSLVEQRAAVRGLTGVVSSRIRLYPHQLEVTRRVLEDPVQRYLLADEVGLGKTIEAGVIIRQLLLDDPKARVLVIVPPLLEAQWRSELRDKIRLNPDSPQIVIRATDELLDASLGQFDLVVIDEAQHVAAALRDPRRAWLYEKCRLLSHAAPRLLLLSATPALHHERDFLGMLHLLEPESYRLDDVASFQKRICDRQRIGEFLLAFYEGMSRLRLRLALVELRDLLASDDWVLARSIDLQECCDAIELDRDRVDALIRSVRVHICETHRVFRRMIRTSRSSQAREALGNRAPEDGSSPVTPEYDVDIRCTRIQDLLEEWREGAAAAVLDRRDDTGYRASLSRIFRCLLECSGTYLYLLEKAIHCRRATVRHQARFEDILGVWAAEDVSLPVTFPGEDDLLCSLLDALDQEPDAWDQVDAVVSAVKLSRESGHRTSVVFTSFTQAAHEIADRLRAGTSPATVFAHTWDASPAENHKRLREFEAATGTATLVCDRSGEEGINLQFADLLVHFDLPWDPNRLEQRIGRLDRIGRNTSVPARVFVGSDHALSLQDAWFQLLDQGFGIFRRSAADLQFYCDIVMPRVREMALMEGATGLLNLIPEVREGIDQERYSLREQSALDEIDAFNREGTASWPTLIVQDQQDRMMQAALEAWLVHRLNFGRRALPHAGREGAVVHYYCHPNTLLPTAMTSTLEDLQPGNGTFDRSLACESHDLQLFRLGDPFIDAVARLVQWDDRGRAYAMWRHLNGLGEDFVATFFEVDYLVSADPVPLRKALANANWPMSAEKPLLRQADAWFPPSRQVLFINSSMRVEQREVVINALRRPYLAHDKGGSDYNLRPSRLWAVDEILSSDRWKAQCVEVRDIAEARIRNHGGFKDQCRAASERASQELERRTEQLRQAIRLQRDISSATFSAQEERIESERSVYTALIEGLSRPMTVVDAIGLVVLSGRNPFQNDANNAT
jgi:ATP-dependent helicase HepA